MKKTILDHLPKATAYRIGGGSAGGVVPLHVDGLVVRRDDGGVQKYRGITAFRGPEWVWKQEFGLLEDYYGWARELGVNSVRWFAIWNNTGFGPLKLGEGTYYDVMETALEHAKQCGVYVHLVALTDQKPSNPDVYLPYDGSGLTQVEHVRRLVEISKRVGNTFPFEISNEDTDPDSGGTAGWFEKSMFDGLPLATRSTWFGDENPQLPDRNGQPSPYLTMVTVHLPRGDDFACKGKVLFEAQLQGLGEYPAARLPSISGEPIRIAEGTTPRAHADNAAVCELMGCGGLIHGGFKEIEPGHDSDLQSCRIPTGPALDCCLAIADTWRGCDEVWDPLAGTTGRYVRGNADDSGDCPIHHRDRSEYPNNGTWRSYFFEVGSKMYGLGVDPGPDWRVEPKPGWRVEVQAGYDEAPWGGNLLVMART